MIDFVIRQLFRWESLRLAIFSEVDWHNSIVRTMNDPDAMKIATAMWCETDGWRGWTIKDDGTYFFNDIAEFSLSDLMGVLCEREGF